MKIELDDLTVLLRPPSKEDLPIVSLGISSLASTLYTHQFFAQPLENELEWYDRHRNERGSCVWGITAPDKEDVLIGVTSIERIDLSNSCTTGIIIWDRYWWGKGVATRAHLARTLFAADVLNRFTIRSSAIVRNEASVKALLRVGYSIVGREPRVAYRQGEFLDLYTMCWFHPERINLLFPEGLPAEYREGVQKASQALERARKVVEFL